MKKGTSLMQIPIQSLNCKHSKKFEFGFSEDIYKYELKQEDFNEIELVLSNGSIFAVD